MYENLMVTLFFSGYLVVMETVKFAVKPLMAKHLKELIGDTEVYGWPVVRLNYTVWLQQLENCHAS